MSLFEPIKSVEILSVHTDSISRSVGAAIDDQGSLFVDGEDWGKLPLEQLGGSYDYSVTVEKDYLESILLLLIKEQFSDFPEFEKWLKEKNIPHRSWSYS